MLSIPFAQVTEPEGYSRPPSREKTKVYTDDWKRYRSVTGDDSIRLVPLSFKVNIISRVEILPLKA